MRKQFQVIFNLFMRKKRLYPHKNSIDQMHDVYEELVYDVEEKLHAVFIIIYSSSNHFTI